MKLVRQRSDELIGPALNWAMCLIKGIDAKIPAYAEFPRVLCTSDVGLDYWCPDYNTDWNAVGPIIDDEKITISSDIDHTNPPAWWAGKNGTLSHVGPTPLVAAMRCYVISKLGDEIDIPEYLSDKYKRP